MSTPAGSDPNLTPWGGQPAQPAEPTPAFPDQHDVWGQQPNAWAQPATPGPEPEPAPEAAAANVWGSQQSAWPTSPAEPVAQDHGWAQQQAFQEPPQAPAPSPWPAPSTTPEPQTAPPVWGSATSQPTEPPAPWPSATPEAPPVWGEQVAPAWGNAQPTWDTASAPEAPAPVWPSTAEPEPPALAPQDAWGNPAPVAGWDTQPAQPQAPTWDTQPATPTWPAEPAVTSPVATQPAVVVGDVAPQPPSWAQRRPISELQQPPAATSSPAVTGDPGADPAWMIWKRIPDSVWERISPRTAAIAVAGVVLILGVLIFTPNLFGSGDGASGANAAAVQSPPEGSTKIGPISMVLPEAIGPWTAQDQALLDATAAESTKNGATVTNMAGYTSVNAATVVASVLPAGTHNGLATADDSIARLATTLGLEGATPVTATWTGGSLPSRALDLDMGDGRTIAVYIELPDGALVAVSVSGPTSAFATGELTSAALSATYTG